MNKNSFRDSLRRAQNAMNKATTSIQGAIENNQEAISRLNPKNPLVQYAQGVQDVANLVAHPVKTSKAVVNQTKKEVKETIKNPVGTYLKNNPVSVAYNTGKEIIEQGVPRTLGQMSATSSGIAKAPIKTPVKVSTPVGGSLGGDAIVVSARPQALNFQASLLERAGVPLKQAKQDIAQSISRNSDLPNKAVGSYNQITGDINISPNTKIQQYGRSSYDVGTHETAHRTLQRLEALENAGLITPEGAEFLHNLRQSQSNKLTPLAENEAVSRGFELARNPNIKFNKQTLNDLMINLSDIENAAKTISPYYRDFLNGGKSID